MLLKPECLTIARTAKQLLIEDNIAMLDRNSTETDMIAIVTPCFNENDTIITVLRQIEATLADLPHQFTVVVVNDASTDNTLALLQEFVFAADNFSLDIITLRFNLGHQRAIYQGLTYARTLEAERFIVMDADGEDDPRAIINLLAYREADVVHVVRGQRNESVLFRLAYYFYKILFKVITGKHMNFGNYCMINRPVLDNVVHFSFIHFAAYLSKIKVKHAYIVHARQNRLGGSSKMNVGSLVFHAFKSLTEYAESLLMLFLKLFILLAGCFTLLIFYILYQKLFTDQAILGWASTMSVGLFNTALIAIGFYVIGIILLNITQHRNPAFQQAMYQRVTPKQVHQRESTLLTNNS